MSDHPVETEQQVTVVIDRAAAEALTNAWGWPPDAVDDAERGKDMLRAALTAPSQDSSPEQTTKDWLRSEAACDIAMDAAVGVHLEEGELVPSDGEINFEAALNALADALPETTEGEATRERAPHIHDGRDDL